MSSIAQLLNAVHPRDPNENQKTQDAIAADCKARADAAAKQPRVLDRRRYDVLSAELSQLSEHLERRNEVIRVLTPEVARLTDQVTAHRDAVKKLSGVKYSNVQAERDQLERRLERLERDLKNETERLAISQGIVNGVPGKSAGLTQRIAEWHDLNDVEFSALCALEKSIAAAMPRKGSIGQRGGGGGMGVFR